MKSHELYTLLGEIDSKYISDACPRNINKEKNHMTQKIRKKTIYGALAFAACFALMLTGVIGCFTRSGNSNGNLITITLDVNPSLEIKVKEDEKVLEVIPLNEDAKAVIGEMDFEGNNIDVTIHAIIGSMVTKGYLTEFKNSVLVSVESENDTSALRERLMSEISALIGENNLGGSVITQRVNADDKLKELAEKYNISVGKAQLINAVLAVKTDRTFDELAAVSVTELYLALGEEYFTENNNSIELEAEGAVVNKQYCGVEHAVKEAIEHYGYSEREITRLETKLDVIDGLICYTVKFRVETENHFKNYQVIINAVTGHFQTGGYSGGKYGEDKEPTDNVPEGHLNTIDAMDLACQRIGGTFDAKADIYLSQIEGEYIWHIEMETETIIYSMDMYTKTGEIVNYKESPKS